MTPVGSINAWQCDRCHNYLVARHADAGVTPMFLACRRDNCEGRGVSLGYPNGPVPDFLMSQLWWEWRKASTTQMKRWKRTDPGMYQHCVQGGLVLREIES